MSHAMNLKERALNSAWKLISLPRVYRYARRFDMKSLFGFRLTAPDQVLVEVTNHCNIRCIMCSHTYFPRPRGFMSLDLYRNMIDQIRVPLDINHFGLGEPLLHRDIIKMIRYSSSRGMKTQLVTNGTLLSENMGRELIRGGLDHLWISIDGATKETYEKIRPGANFDTVITNVENFIRLSNEANGKRTAVGFGTVPMVSNLNELPDVARLAARLGIDHLDIHRFADAAGEDPSIVLKINSEDPFASPETKEKLRLALDEVREISRETGLGVCTPPGDGDLLYRPPRRCAMPYTYPLISWEGYMMPCFCFVDPGEFNVGNLKDTPFYVLWNSRPYREFREALVSRHPPKKCTECKIFHGISQLWSDYREI